MLKPCPSPAYTSPNAHRGWICVIESDEPTMAHIDIYSRQTRFR